jgi:hypothetical protein
MFGKGISSSAESISIEIITQLQRPMDTCDFRRFTILVQSIGYTKDTHDETCRGGFGN